MADISRKDEKVQSSRSNLNPVFKSSLLFLRNGYNLSVPSFQWFVLLLIYLTITFLSVISEDGFKHVRIDLSSQEVGLCQLTVSFFLKARMFGINQTQ